jgi:hypothetical protein
MTLIWYFLAGFCAFNGMPHIIKGITGQKHMTPFARVSSPQLNVIWGFTNAIIALFLLGLASQKGGLVLPWEANLMGLNLWTFLAGAVTVALYLANFWSNPKAKLPWQ